MVLQKVGMKIEKIDPQKPRNRGGCSIAYKYICVNHANQVKLQLHLHITLTHYSQSYTPILRILADHAK